MKTLYFDLDGTLIDVRRRHFAAYTDAARELGLTPLNEGEFWARRRDGAELEDLVADLSTDDLEQFEQRWHELADAPSYVRLDALVPGARATLAALREAYELVLVTLREDREALLHQLDEFSLTDLFSQVYSAEGQKAPTSKAELIELVGDRNGDDAAVIGDAEDDVEAARALGVNAMLIASGLRSRRYLEMWEPDELFTSLTELRRALESGGAQPTNE